MCTYQLSSRWIASGVDMDKAWSWVSAFHPGRGEAVNVDVDVDMDMDVDVDMHLGK